jgi:UDP-2,3-diacylglucosamine hydrolase
MRLIFISDLHLNSDDSINTALFVASLQQWVRECDALYILGDLFDYWLGDDDSNEFIIAIKSALYQFTRRRPIYLIVGNHDFGLGSVFANDTGVSIIEDGSAIAISGDRCLLSHGDRFCTLDTAYQRMRRLIRSRIVMSLMRMLSLANRMRIKDYLQNSSRRNHVPVNYNLERYNVVPTAIWQLAAVHHCGMVIHGHTHKPGVYRLDSAVDDRYLMRIELPNWHPHASHAKYLLYDDGHFVLHA